MARVSEAEKQESHRRIIDAAARLMRKNGIASVSISDVMNKAKLTHGGFYRHFDSKDALAAAAFRHAVDTMLSDIEGARTDAEKIQARERYLSTYLSTRHLNNRPSGCPLASLGAETSVQDGEARKAAIEAIHRMSAVLDDDPESTPEHAGERGLALMALLVGSMTLARIADDSKDAERILNAGNSAVSILKDKFESNS